MKMPSKIYVKPPAEYGYNRNTLRLWSESNEYNEEQSYIRADLVNSIADAVEEFIHGLGSLQDVNDAVQAYRNLTP